MATISTRAEHRSDRDTPNDGREAWDRIAPGYDRTNTHTQMWIANEGLRRAGLREGMRFLDVAAGSGAMSIPATRLGAQILAVDQSAVMLDLLATRARAEGLKVETRVMDGHALQFPNDSFHVTGSQFGVMPPQRPDHCATQVFKSFAVAEQLHAEFAFERRFTQLRQRSQRREQVAVPPRIILGGRQLEWRDRGVVIELMPRPSEKIIVPTGLRRLLRH